MRTSAGKRYGPWGSSPKGMTMSSDSPKQPCGTQRILRQCAPWRPCLLDGPGPGRPTPCHCCAKHNKTRTGNCSTRPERPSGPSKTDILVIKPWLQDEAFLADVADARKDWEQFHLWWVGQSGFLLQWRGRHLLFDPYLSDSLTKKYANTDKPHARMTGRVVAPERLKVIDVVTSSHNHTDHLDPETLVPLLRGNSNLELIIPEANREFVVDRLQVPAELPRGLDAGQFTTVAGFKI